MHTIINPPPPPTQPGQPVCAQAFQAHNNLNPLLRDNLHIHTTHRQTCRIGATGFAYCTPTTLLPLLHPPTTMHLQVPGLVRMAGCNNNPGSCTLLFNIIPPPRP